LGELGGRLYAGSSAGELISSSDGESWTDEGAPPDSAKIWAIIDEDDDNLKVATSSHIYRFTPSTGDWTEELARGAFSFVYGADRDRATEELLLGNAYNAPYILLKEVGGSWEENLFGSEGSGKGKIKMFTTATQKDASAHSAHPLYLIPETRRGWSGHTAMSRLWVTDLKGRTGCVYEGLAGITDVAVYRGRLFLAYSWEATVPSTRDHSNRTQHAGVFEIPWTQVADADPLPVRQTFWTVPPSPREIHRTR